ncbi:acyltransferase family protein [Sinomonas gamaensis]|uniref:acyltransferase family protein n=1 Tax=Sinomonas gamaensis TaxID=2565624 RepID=UPI001109FCC2|nr:acyltransferase [Sinomonas gamaensis]
MNRTLGDALNGRDNALNSIRLLLAVAVIFWHTYPISGTNPSWPASTVGSWAVNSFFAISGFLVAGSRLRLNFSHYLIRRAARVFPAFWVVLVVTAFVLAPFSTLFTGSPYSFFEGVNYVSQNFLLWLGELAVGSTLSGVPHANSWNGSLWTLFHEFGAYLVAGGVLSLALVRKHIAFAALTAVVLLSAAVASGFGHTLPGFLSQAGPASRLWSFFAAGVLVYALRDRLSTRPPIVIASAGLLCLTFTLGIAEWLGQIFLAVTLLWLGARLPLRMGSRNDLSYGVYIYAFPVQQLLVVSGITPIAGPELSAVLAAVLTLPLAWASWTLVEKPCNRLASRFTRYTPGAEREDRLRS